MAKIYYKVVNESGVGLISSTAFLFTVYKENEWTNAPNNTRLFVFEHLKDAKEFAKDWNSVVYECKVKGGFKGYGTLGAKQSFWSKVNEFLSKKKRVNWDRKNFGSLTNIPAFLVKSVKLTKRLGPHWEIKDDSVSG